MKTYPNFIGVGARKAGTTWLSECLREHPEIFMSTPKEISYFGSKYQRRSRTEDWYFSHFENPQNCKVIGEFSPSYLANEDAANRIFSDLGQIKIIVVLRNPVERFLSDYKHGIREQIFKFEDANRFDKRKFEYLSKSKPKIVQRGCYHQCLSRYYGRFLSQNIHVILKEDIDQEPALALRNLFAFLEVDPDFLPVMTGKNISVGMIPRSKALESSRIKVHHYSKKKFPGLINFIKKTGLADRYRALNSSRQKFQVDPDCLQSLYDYYKTDVEQTAELINRDLSGWKYRKN